MYLHQIYMYLLFCKLIWWPWPYDQAEVQSVFADGSLSLHTRSLKYGKVRVKFWFISRKFCLDFMLEFVLQRISKFCWWSFMWLYLQLGQGTLIQVSPSLIKRRKTHFHHLPCGATIILGNNGYVWICPTETEEMDQTGGYQLSMEVYKLIM